MAQLVQPSYVRVADLSLTKDEFGRILRRIGLTRDEVKGAPSKDLLFLLHQRFFHAMPFENIGVFEGEVVSLDLKFLVDKMCGPDGNSPRGGYCFELNKVFAALLLHLGFEVEPKGSRVFLDDGVTPRLPTYPLMTHMVLVVSAGAELFLCDVAFGKVGLVNPVPLDSANTGPFNGGHFRLKLERQTFRSRHAFQYDSYFLWYTEETHSETSKWTRGYSFVPVQDFDFMDALPCNLQVHGYFESPLTQRLWCEKRSLEAHVRILGKHFLEKTSEGTVQRDIDTAEELQALLLHHFRLSISKRMCQHMLGVGTAAASEDKWRRLVAARAGAGSANSQTRLVLGIAFSLAALALVGWIKRP
mmetsp:Transcript_42250/g.98591  ORF Transcript_42250/g.98591 Transcript_42250/m.98591 type:complete len:359 (-) Transcript_42250:46-1122(-)